MKLVPATGENPLKLLIERLLVKAVPSGEIFDNELDPLFEVFRPPLATCFATEEDNRFVPLGILLTEATFGTEIDTFGVETDDVIPSVLYA